MQKAKTIEKIFRWETGHFKSKQYKLTGSAGMEDGKWKGLIPGTYTTITMLDNHPEKVTNPMRVFIKWNSVYDAMLYLSDYIDRHKGHWGRWNSTDDNKSAKYMSEVSLVKNKFV